MLNEPRVFRHPPFQIILSILVFVILGFVILTSFDAETTPILLPFGIIILLSAIYSLYTMTGKTIISDSEISVQNILETKSLGWSEISRVTGRGHGIKLHNFDGDVTVSPSAQLPGYEKVVEWIGMKRSDLFEPQENEEMRRNWLTILLMGIILVLIIAFGSLTVIQSGQWFLAIFFVFVGAVLMAVIASSPQSITLEGRSLLVKYMFSQQSLREREIQSVELRSQRTRNGKSYHIRLNLLDGKGLRISGLGPSLPIVYLKLKNWHKKHNFRVQNRDIV